MNDREYRVALCGCGHVARIHIAALAPVRQARVVALCDPVAQRASELAAGLPGAKVYTDLSEAIAEARPDVAHVLTPVGSHAAAAITALSSGCNVLVEKPLATDAAECRQILAAAARARRTVGVDHNRLFDPVMQRARALLDAGALGSLVGAEVFQGFERSGRNNPYADPGHWTHRLPGGILHNLAPHPVYLLAAVIGWPNQIHAAHARPGIIGPSAVEEVRVALRGERGVGTLTLSLATRPFMTTMAIYGSEASAWLDFGTQSLVIRRPARGPKLIAKAWASIDQSVQLLAEAARTGLQVARRKLPLYPGMHALIRKFYASLDSGAPPPVTGADGLATVELLDALWAQCREPTAAPREASA